MKRNKLFIAISLGMLLLILLCWGLGQIQTPQPEIKQQVELCPNPLDTVITATLTGYGYLDYDNNITQSYTAITTKTITVCRWYIQHLPIIEK